MRVLLDECMPRSLRLDLAGHDVRTVRGMGWAGTKNGVLLRRAAPLFDVLLTVDQSIQHQQNLQAIGLAVVILIAPDNEKESLLPLIPRVLEVFQTIQPGDLVLIEA
jgi:hypothetical protein